MIHISSQDAETFDLKQNKSLSNELCFWTLSIVLHNLSTGFYPEPNKFISEYYVYTKRLLLTLTILK